MIRQMPNGLAGIIDDYLCIDGRLRDWNNITNFIISSLRCHLPKSFHVFYVALSEENRMNRYIIYERGGLRYTT